MTWVLGLLGSLPRSIIFAAAGLMAAFLAAWGIYHLGDRHGYQRAAVSALESSVKILRKRNEIDETVSHADAAALCADFGLPDDKIPECVRRLDKADAEP